MKKILIALAFFFPFIALASGGTYPVGSLIVGNGVFFTSTTSPTVGYITSTSTATSTFAGGIKLTGGCVVVAGSCLGSGGGTFTAIGPAGQTQSGPTVTIATSSTPFNGLTASTTVTGSGNVLTFTNTLAGLLGIGGGGTGTSTTPSYGNVLVGNKTGGYDYVATSTFAGGGGGGGVTGTTGQVAYLSNTNTGTGTSTIFITPAGLVGIGTTTPWDGFTVVSTSTKGFTLGNDINNNLKATFLSGGLTSVPSYSNPGGTGNRTGIISLSTTLATVGTLSRLVDGDTTTNNFFWTSAAATGNYLEFDFGAGTPKLITEARYYQGNGTVQADFQWQGSNDNSTWTNIGSTFTLGGTPTQTITALSGNTFGYRYYRMLGVSGSMSSSPFVYQFEFKIDDYKVATYGLLQTYANGVAAGALVLQKDGGSVGIGTTAPVSKFDVFGNMSLGSYAGSSAAPTNGLIVSGNMGVGTTSPGTKLDVYGDVTIEQGGAHIGAIVCYMANGKLGYMTQTALLAGAGSATCSAN